MLFMCWTSLVNISSTCFGQKIPVGQMNNINGLLVEQYVYIFYIHKVSFHLHKFRTMLQLGIEACDFLEFPLDFGINQELVICCTLSSHNQIFSETAQHLVMTYVLCFKISTKDDENLHDKFTSMKLASDAHRCSNQYKQNASHKGTTKCTRWQTRRLQYWCNMLECTHM